jgi:hypothetical protein
MKKYSGSPKKKIDLIVKQIYYDFKEQYEKADIRMIIDEKRKSGKRKKPIHVKLNIGEKIVDCVIESYKKYSHYLAAKKWRESNGKPRKDIERIKEIAKIVSIQLNKYDTSVVQKIILELSRKGPRTKTIYEVLKYRKTCIDEVKEKYQTYINTERVKRYRNKKKGIEQQNGNTISSAAVPVLRAFDSDIITINNEVDNVVTI